MLRGLMDRRVVCVLSVALVLGCSYDWSIGPGIPPETSEAGTATPIPRDGGPRSDGGEGDGGLDCASGTCECKGSETCAFQCAKGPCNVTCSGSSQCTLACAPGSNCTLACLDDAKCDMDCTAGRATCKLVCKDDATCRSECKAASFCTRDCKQKCSVECSAGGICL